MIIKAVFWDWSDTIYTNLKTINKDALTVLEFIYNKNIIQGIITNGQIDQIHSIIYANKLEKYFLNATMSKLNLIAPDNKYLPKPSSQMFITLLSSMNNIRNVEVLFIGDSLADEMMSANCECSFLNIMEINKIYSFIWG